MRLGFIALLSRDWPMALGDSLNHDCTVRACRVPRLFKSIFSKRLNPAVIASVDCMSSISDVTPIIGGHATNLLEHFPNLNKTGIASDEHVTSLVSRLSSIPRAWHYLCRKRDNVNDHRTAAIDLQAEKAARPATTCAPYCYRTVWFIRVLISQNQTGPKVQPRQEKNKPQPLCNDQSQCHIGDMQYLGCSPYSRPHAGRQRDIALLPTLTRFHIWSRQEGA